jgi:hypothetical protein
VRLGSAALARSQLFYLSGRDFPIHSEFFWLMNAKNAGKKFIKQSSRETGRGPKQVARDSAQPRDIYLVEEGIVQLSMLIKYGKCTSLLVLFSYELSMIGLGLTSVPRDWVLNSEGSPQQDRPHAVSFSLLPCSLT